MGKDFKALAAAIVWGSSAFACAQLNKQENCRGCPDLA